MYFLAVLLVRSHDICSRFTAHTSDIPTKFLARYKFVT